MALLLSASAVTWAAALLLERLRVKWMRRVCLVVSLALCVGCLFYYKYFNFLGETLAALLDSFGLHYTAPSLDILAPVGISYFTFAALGYVIDVYRGRQRAEKNFFFMRSLSAFSLYRHRPHRARGAYDPPIQNAADLRLRPRFRRAVPHSVGLFQKFVIANTLGTAVDAVYGNPGYGAYTGPILLLASLLYTYQLYCDFSAGCDVALGAGAVFGFELTENFRQPLHARSFTELWRRWHISLTSWFRDYLYIPLGGNRRGKARQYINQLVVFLVSGLWHGASLSMVVWGLLNGVYLCVGKATQDARRKLTRHNPLYHFTPVRRIFQTAVTYLLFTSCIIFFRSSEVFEGSKGIADALYIYGHLFSGWGKLFTAPDAIGRALVSIGLSVQTALVLAVSILVVETLESVQEPVNRTIRKVPIFLRWPLYYALVLGMLFFGSFANSGSIYGRF